MLKQSLDETPDKTSAFTLSSLVIVGNWEPVSSARPSSELSRLSLRTVDNGQTFVQCAFVRAATHLPEAVVNPSG